jgi:hypothetical protein
MWLRAQSKQTLKTKRTSKRVCIPRNALYGCTCIGGRMVDDATAHFQKTNKANHRICLGRRQHAKCATVAIGILVPHGVVRLMTQRELRDGQTSRIVSVQMQRYDYLFPQACQQQRAKTRASAAAQPVCQLKSCSMAKNQQHIR